MIVKVAEPRLAQIEVDNVMPGDHRLGIEPAVAQIDLQSRHAQRVARLGKADCARRVGRLLGVIEARVTPRLVANEEAGQARYLRWMRDRLSIDPRPRRDAFPSAAC